MQSADQAEIAPTPFVLGYRPELDGLRGVSIFFVVLFHYFYKISFLGGYIGVDVFFVLSGFLITVILLEERRSTGAISFRRFYARRALRLLPALIVTLIFVDVQALVARSRPVFVATVKHSLVALFYFSNWVIAFRINNMNPLSHTWSLSIEEQFYVVWPLLLLAMLRFIRDPRRIAIVLTAAMFLICAWRSILFAAYGVERAYLGTDARADSLLAGCIAGILVANGLAPSAAATLKAIRLASYATVIGLTYVLLRVFNTSPFMNTLGYSFVAAGVAILIIDLIYMDSRLKSFLRMKWLVRLGRISYGVYLWHLLVITLSPFYALYNRLPRAGIAVIWMAGTIAFATASYVLVERPLLSLKRGFRPHALGRPAKVLAAD